MADAVKPPSTTMSSQAPDSAAAANALTAQEAIRPWIAAMMGSGLVVVSLLAFVIIAMLPSNPRSLGFDATSGTATLSITLIGLLVLSRAVGVTDATQALGLPNGSVRAIIALFFALVFVAVASWTLGGMYNPLGPQLEMRDIKNTDLASFKSQDADKDHLLTVTPKDSESSTVRIYLRNQPSESMIDLSKQIITISATVLVTVVGFYFGSKSSSDAVRSATATITAMRKELSGADGTDNAPDSTSPVSVEGVKNDINAIAALARAMKGKFDALGDAPLEKLQSAIAASPRTAPPGALKDAEDSFTILAAKRNSAQQSLDQAAPIAALADKAEPGALAKLASQTAALLVSTKTDNHDFEEAFSKFTAANAAVLKAIAI